VKRKYHDWSEDELVAVREYITRTLHPTSLYRLLVLAKGLGVSAGAARGAVVRELVRIRMQNDLRDE
jgi:hypothetical protein